MWIDRLRDEIMKVPRSLWAIYIHNFRSIRRSKLRTTNNDTLSVSNILNSSSSQNIAIEEVANGKEED